MDILLLVLGFAFGWFIGQFLLIRKLRNVILDNADKLGIKTETTKRLVPICIIEKVNNHLYLYDQETNKFYCQAPTLDELAENMYKDAKIDVALVVESMDTNPIVWLFKNGKSEPAKLNET